MFLQNLNIFVWTRRRFLNMSWCYPSTIEWMFFSNWVDLALLSSWMWCLEKNASEEHVCNTFTYVEYWYTLQGDQGVQGPPGLDGMKGDKGERGMRGKRVNKIRDLFTKWRCYVITLFRLGFYKSHTIGQMLVLLISILFFISGSTWAGRHEGSCLHLEKY